MDAGCAVRCSTIRSTNTMAKWRQIIRAATILPGCVFGFSADSSRYNNSSRRIDTKPFATASSSLSFFGNGRIAAPATTTGSNDVRSRGLAAYSTQKRRVGGAGSSSDSDDDGGEAMLVRSLGGVPASRHLVAAERTHDGDDYDYDDREIAPCCGRRRFMWSVTLTSLVVGANDINSIPELALAVETETVGEYTIWKTGRAPIVPGQKPRDKDDVKGTRKDPNFLRSVADCKGKCENTPGSDGLARTKEECLTTCQDICCTTYEQCTFAIVPR